MNITHLKNVSVYDGTYVGSQTDILAAVGTSVPVLKQGVTCMKWGP